MGWVFNNRTYSSCPVSNIWQLTDDQFDGRVAMADPLSNPKYPYWLNTMALNDDAGLRSAYEQHYGTELTTDQPDAAHEWVKRFAQNHPKLTQTDEEVSEAVGAPGPPGAELRPHVHGEVPQHRSDGLPLGSLRRHETMGASVVPVCDRIRSQD